jgi:hypothetical protein
MGAHYVPIFGVLAAEDLDHIGVAAAEDLDHMGISAEDLDHLGVSAATDMDSGLLSEDPGHLTQTNPRSSKICFIYGSYLYVLSTSLLYHLNCFLFMRNGQHVMVKVIH